MVLTHTFRKKKKKKKKKQLTGKDNSRDQINHGVRAYDMSLGAEILLAIVGLWGVFLRPKMLRYAAEMACGIYRIVTQTPSFRLSNYIP